MTVSKMVQRRIALGVAFAGVLVGGLAATVPSYAAAACPATISPIYFNPPDGDDPSYDFADNFRNNAGRNTTTRCWYDGRRVTGDGIGHETIRPYSTTTVRR